jgi:cathepsin B
MKYLLSIIYSMSLIFMISSKNVADFAMIDYINSVQDHWTAHNSPRFENTTFDQVKTLCGTIIDTHTVDTNLLVSDTDIYTADIPDTYDATTAKPECISVIGHVRDQSDCGSCWAFGTVESFNDRRCLKYSDQTIYSAEDILSCCSGIRCGLSQGCNGGNPTAAWKWLTTTGVTSGGDFDTVQSGSSCNPYPFAPCSHHVDSELPNCPTSEYETPQCTQKCIDTKYTKSYKEDKVLAKTSYTIQGESNIMADIFLHGSVTAAFTVYEDFTAYKSGVYKHVFGDELGGHAISIVGYGVDEKSGLPYWRCKNSWNILWGDGGYFKILRGVDECGIESSVSAGLV